MVLFTCRFLIGWRIATKTTRSQSQPLAASRQRPAASRQQMKKQKQDFKHFKNNKYGKNIYQGTPALVCTGHTCNKPT
jgi:hypothetical protein